MEAVKDNTVKAIKQMIYQGFVDNESYIRVVELNPEIAHMVADSLSTSIGGVRNLIKFDLVKPNHFFNALEKYRKTLKKNTQA